MHNGLSGSGAGLVQDLDNLNYTDLWKLSPTDYRIFTELELVQPWRGDRRDHQHRPRAQFLGHPVRRDRLDVHQRLSLPHGLGRNLLRGPLALAQPGRDRPGTRTVDRGVGDKQSNQHTAAPGQWIFPYTRSATGTEDPEANAAVSWTDAQVVSPGGDAMTDPNPPEANSGQGAVEITYGYTQPFNNRVRLPGRDAVRMRMRRRDRFLCLSSSAIRSPAPGKTMTPTGGRHEDEDDRHRGALRHRRGG